VPVAVVATSVNSEVVESSGGRPRQSQVGPVVVAVPSKDTVDPVALHTPTEPRAVGDPARVKSDPSSVNLVVVVAVLSTDAGDPVAVHTPPEPRMDGDLVRSAVGDPMAGVAAKSLKGSLLTLGRAMPSFGGSVQRRFSINSRASINIFPLFLLASFSL